MIRLFTNLIFFVIKCIIKTTLDDMEINYNYDSLGRLENSNINNNYPISYKYVTNGKRTSMLVESISNNGDKYLYKYDELNNITHIYHNNILENEYYYDDYNELIKENNYLLNQTIKYQYDDLGNMLYKKIYELNTDNLLNQNTYEYNNTNWKDQLTKFNNDNITYDEIGNPLTIGENINLSWINGRQLDSYIDLNNNINYKYNKDGIRISKKINNVETKYYVEGTDIIVEKTGDNVLYFIHNDIDGLVGFKYNEDLYYYVKNNQDDIIGILDSNYNVIAKYSYDSWGNIISITDGNGIDVSTNLEHIASINPFRYRSYYYDKETKLYYLNSRYYNPMWGRFINADNVICSNQDILSYNLYAYCSNNPVNNVDSSGKGWLKKLWKKITKFVTKKIEKIKNVCSAVTSKKKSKKFVAEVGAGYGASANVNVGGKKIGIGAYQDRTIGTKNNKTYNNITGKIQAGVDVFSISDTYIHQTFDLPEPGFGHTIDNFDVARCDLTTHTPEINIGNITNDTLFLGLELDIHAILGIHVKIGWEIDISPKVEKKK